MDNLLFANVVFAVLNGFMAIGSLAAGKPYHAALSAFVGVFNAVTALHLSGGI